MHAVLTVLSGIFLPILLLLAGAYFLFLLLPLMCHRPLGGFRGKGGGGGSAGALWVALAGTLGVGNIAGVASAVALGGAGAVFWLWVSSLFAMMLKYAEVVLALRTRRFDGGGVPHGGAMYYIRKAFGGRVGAGLSALFAVLCALASLTLGSMVQSAAAAEAAATVFGVSPLLVGVLLGGGAALVLFLGAGRVERACTALVPAATVLFLLASLLALFLRREALPAAFSAIFKGAFRFSSGAAGFFGFFTSRAVRYGVTRGLVSNEAGCGTAPIAHAAARVSSPALQGLWGMLEVLVDTPLLCSATALVLLVSGVSAGAGGGMSFAIAAYRAVLGAPAAPLLALCAVLFAFATVICWAHYGAECMTYLWGSKKAPLTLWVAVPLAAVWGAVAAPGAVWDITDFVLCLMALLNITVLLLLRRDVLLETRAFFKP